MNLMIIVSLVSALFAGAVGYGTASHFCSVKILKIENEAKNERITVQRAARANAERVAGQISAAQGEAQRRLAAADRDRRSAVGELERLRDASATTVRIVATTPATCDNITAAYRDILAEGSSFIQEVVADVDKCGIERQTLIDAWPR